MHKLITALAILTLAISIGCDEPEPAEEEPDEPAVEEEEDHAHDDDHHHDDDHDSANDHDHGDDHAHDDDHDHDHGDEEASKAEDGAIAITVTAGGFEPSNIEAPAGEELTLEFTRQVEEGCMTEVVFPELDIEEELPLDETVAVSITPEEGEAIGFECGMGMGKSTVTGT